MSVTSTNRSQPPTPRGREKWQTKTNTYETKCTRSTDQLSSPSEVTTMLKVMKKHEEKQHGKNLKHEAPRSINHKATHNKTLESAWKTFFE